MPRLSKQAPKYRKHVSGQACVAINGKTHYLGPHNSKESWRKYHCLIGQWETSNRSPLFGVPAEEKPITIVEVIREYRKWAESYYREDGIPTGTAGNMRPIMKRLRLWYGNELACEFNAKKLKDIVRRLISEGLSISTINDHTCRIRHMFRWASSERLVNVSVFNELETVDLQRQGRSEAKPRKIVQAVPDSVVDATLPHLPVMVADMVRLQRLTGARPGEICGMKPIEITAFEDVLLYRPAKHKTRHHGKIRVVVIAGVAIEILKKYLNDSEGEYIFSPQKSALQSLAERSANRKTPMSCGTKPKAKRKIPGGNKYQEASYRRVIKRACERNNIPPWSPNQLRHAAAEEIQARVGIEATSAQLGHSKIDTTRLYAKHNLTLAIQAAKSITGASSDA